MSAPGKINLLVISDPARPQLRMLDPLRERVNITAGNTVEELAAATREADVILRWTDDGDLFRGVWENAAKVRWVHSMSAGVEKTLSKELRESRVPLTNSRGVYKRSLAEFVMTSALFFAKDLARMRRNQMAAKWEQFDVEEVHGQVMGILGYGEIGNATARLAQAFGMRVWAVRNRPEKSRDDPFVEKVLSPHHKDELLAAADYLVICAPLTPETRGMVGDREIRLMKKSTVIINIGRGPVVDEPALIAALREGRLRGAALDVFDEEPLPAGHPFWGMENVLLSPHTADHTATWLDDAMQFFLENFQRFEEGDPLWNIVDKELGY